MNTSIEMRIIGRASTPWRRREDAPHQPSAAANSAATIIIDAEYRAALADLDSFGRIWVLFLFDEVRVQGIDLLDDTPILDLKPYIPFIDAWPDAGHGWLEPYLEAGIEPRLKKPFRPLRAK
jgi:tRNA (Thr-GGU) A37 N-methylase